MSNIKETNYPITMKTGTTNQCDMDLFKHSRLNKAEQKNVQKHTKKNLD